MQTIRGKCPVCGKSMDGPITNWPKFPFCSDRCKQIDLGRWLDGRNNLPVLEPEDDAEQDEP